jgi:hypothetical protein
MCIVPLSCLKYETECNGQCFVLETSGGRRRFPLNLKPFHTNPKQTNIDVPQTASLPSLPPYLAFRAPIFPKSSIPQDASTIWDSCATALSGEASCPSVIKHNPSAYFRLTSASWQIQMIAMVFPTPAISVSPNAKRPNSARDIAQIARNHGYFKLSLR